MQQRTTPSSPVRISKTFVNRNQVEDAHKKVEKALELVYDVRQLPRAINSLSAAIAVRQTQYPSWYLARGMAYRILGHYAHALLDANAAVAVSPRVADGYIFRGLVLYRLHKSSNAVRDFTQALTFDSPKLAVHYFRGVARYDIGEYAEAITDFTAVIASDNERLWGKARIGRARCHFILGSVEGCVGDLAYLLKQDVTNVEALYYLAQVALTQGHLTFAAEVIQQAAQNLSTNYFPPQKVLTLKADIELRAGDVMAAMKDSHIAVASLPNNSALQGWILPEPDSGEAIMPALARVLKELAEAKAEKGTLVTHETAYAYLLRGMAKLACDEPERSLLDLVYAWQVHEAWCKRERNSDNIKDRARGAAADAGRKGSRSSSRDARMASRLRTRRMSTVDKRSSVGDGFEIDSAISNVERALYNPETVARELSETDGYEPHPDMLVNAMGDMLIGLGHGIYRNALAGYTRPSTPAHNRSSTPHKSSVIETAPDDTEDYTPYPSLWNVPPSVIHDDFDNIFDLEDELRIVLDPPETKILRTRKNVSEQEIGTEPSAPPPTGPPTASPADGKPVVSLLAFGYLEKVLVNARDPTNWANNTRLKASKAAVYRGQMGLLPGLELLRAPATPRTSDTRTRASVVGEPDMLLGLLPPQVEARVKALSTSTPWPEKSPNFTMPMTRQSAELMGRIHLALAINYFQLSFMGRALEHIKHAIIANPGNPTAHLMAGMIHQSVNSIPLAIASLGTCITLCREIPQHSYLANSDSVPVELKELLAKGGNAAPEAVESLESANSPTRSPLRSSMLSVYDIPSDSESPIRRRRGRSMDGGGESESPGEAFNPERMSAAVWSQSSSSVVFGSPSIMDVAASSCYKDVTLEGLDVLRKMRKLPSDAKLKKKDVSDLTPSERIHATIESWAPTRLNHAVNITSVVPKEWVALLSKPAVYQEIHNKTISMLYCLRGLMQQSILLHAEAVNDFVSADTVKPDPDFKIHKAVSMLALRQPLEAAELCTGALTMNESATVQGLYYKGLALIGTQEFAQAEKILSAALEKVPEFPGLLALRATAKTGSRKLGSALIDINSALQREPTNSSYLEQRSGIQEQLCRPADAVEDLRLAINQKIQPLEEARMRVKFANVQANLDKPEDAVDQYERALAALARQQDHSEMMLLTEEAFHALREDARNPSFVATKLDHVFGYEVLDVVPTVHLPGTSSEAQEIVDRLFKAYLKQQEAPISRREPLAKQKFIMQQSKRVVDELSKMARDLNMRSTNEVVQLRFTAIYELANSLQIAEKHERAAMYFTAAMAHRPAAAEIYFRRAFSFKVCHEHDLAAEDFETAKELSNSDPRFVVNYAGLKEISTIITSAAGDDPHGETVGCPDVTGPAAIGQAQTIMAKLLIHQVIEREKAKKARSDALHEA